MGKTTIFSLPSLTIQNREELIRSYFGAGDLVHGDGREVG
jgi:hypothetical protein